VGRTSSAQGHGRDDDKPTRTGPHSSDSKHYSRVAVLETLIERWSTTWSGAASRHEATKWRLSQLVPREDSVARVDTKEMEGAMTTYWFVTSRSRSMATAPASQDVEHRSELEAPAPRMDICHPQRRQMIALTAELKISTTLSSRRAIRALRHDHGSEHVRPLRGRGRERMVRLVGEEPPFHHSYSTHALPQPSIEMRGGRRFVSSTAESRRRSRQRSTPR